MAKKPTRGRPKTGQREYHTVNLLSEVRELTRRFLLRHELDTGERIPMSEFVRMAVMEKIQRERANAV